MKQRTGNLLISLLMFAGVVVMLTLTGCATRHGENMAIGTAGDFASTAIALTKDGATEANPLGWALIPVNVGVVYYADKQPCAKGVKIEKGWNTIKGFAIGNNLAVAAGISAPLAVGLVTAAGWFYWRTKNPMVCED